ncbi:MAG: hypothetical protein AAF721_06700 [Myxococcota bacterium]
MAACDRWNTVRYRGDDGGHYESWFLRANHPTEARGFWIRYTIFAPKGRRADAVGELWAIAFDGAERIIAAKSVRPIDDCTFSKTDTNVRIGEATLEAHALVGETQSSTTKIAWDLRYEGTDSPLLLFPEKLYAARLPKAKVVVPQPAVHFRGSLEVDGEQWNIEDWVGSQNHNWGSKHTDFYAWGQVAGFDDAPGTFLECATARLKIGPLWTPPLTVAVLRLPDAEVRLNTIGQALKANATIDGFDWSFASQQGDVRLEGRITAPREAFVGLTYGNPPGGAKTCLNSKIASCELTLSRPGRDPLHLASRNRAAFEILTDDPDPRVPVVV